MVPWDHYAKGPLGLALPIGWCYMDPGWGPDADRYKEGLWPFSRHLLQWNSW
jgi:hypothetical protein